MRCIDKTSVVNLRTSTFDVYIGRAGHGKDGFFGNPYNGPSREENIKNFKKYFYDRLQKDVNFKYKVLSLKDKTLGCFCKPKPCHGDIIVDYIKSVNPIKLAVVGSRTFNDYELLKKSLQTFDIKQIISGGAKGADFLAKKYAQENNISIREFMPDWDRFGKAAGYKRNEQIVQACDELVAFWDGSSKGTKHDIDLAEKMNKPLYIIKFTQESGLPDDEFSLL